MSGIVAIKRDHGAGDPAAMQGALARLRHRGPDGADSWTSDDRRVVLGQVLLALRAGASARPAASADGALRLALDGDLYDHDPLRARLAAVGPPLGDGGDGELLLRLYQERGVHCLEDLRGEFAFALWDGRNRQLFAARDRFGIKPLYYGVFDGVLYLASEAKAIGGAGIPLAWDEEAFYQACCLQYPPPDRSLYRGIMQVPPGHYLVATDASIRVLKYWDYDFPRETPDVLGEQGYVARFTALFDEAVELRLRGEAPVAAYLSGGLDSCAIVATAMRHRRTPIDCFTISFAEEAYDELSVAEAVARHTGAKLLATRLTNQQLADHFAEAVWISEMPAVNLHAAAKYVLSKVVHDHGYKVALTGEGADELAAGYPHFRRDLFASLEQQGTAPPQDLATLAATNALSSGILMPEGDTLPLDAARRVLGYVPTFLETKASFGHRIASLLAPDFAARFAGRDCVQLLLDRHDVAGQLHGRDRVNQSIYLWTKVGCAQYALRLLGDGTEMANSIRGRLPFFDHRLVEFGRALPVSMKIRGTVEKHIIRAAMKDRLPDVVLARQKHPFLAPRQAGAALDTFVQDTLRSAAVRAVPYFDGAALERLLERYPELPPREQLATDPVLTFIASIGVLHQRGTGVGR